MPLGVLKKSVEAQAAAAAFARSKAASTRSSKSEDLDELEPDAFSSAIVFSPPLSRTKTTAIQQLSVPALACPVLLFACINVCGDGVM